MDRVDVWLGGRVKRRITEDGKTFWTLDGQPIVEKTAKQVIKEAYVRELLGQLDRDSQS